jgi:hypothetical protein
MTQTNRRSATGPGLAGVLVAAGPADAPAKVVPQSPQKRLPGGLVAPQLGQPVASAAPQSPQKRLPAGLSVPQDGQGITWSAGLAVWGEGAGTHGREA